jgi:lysine-arginine-ornithine-binding protein
MTRFVTSAIAAMAIVFAAGAADAQQMKKVRIGTEGAYAPFNFIDANKQLQGFDVEIAKAICAAAKFDCEFVVQDWDGIIPGLNAKKYDAIIASMSITDERKKVVDFTDRYYKTPARFVRKMGSKVEITDAGLKGKKVGVQRATIHENFLKDKYGKVVEVRSYATQDEANLDMAAGRIDLLLADSVVLSEGFLKTPDGKAFEFVGPDFTDKKWFGDGAGIALRKGDKELREAINKAIAQIRADGTYKKINDKYFAFDVYGK